MADTMLLIRHGRIAANVQGLWHGSTDSPLLPKGIRQARRTGRHLAVQQVFPAAIYTSPLQRCRDTAALIATELNRHSQQVQQRGHFRNRLHRWSRGLLGSSERVAVRQPLEPVVHENLREYGIGDWEGMLFAELNKQHQFISRAAQDHNFAPPGGESLRGVSQRISATLSDIHAQHPNDQRVLVVAHGAVLGIALATILNQDPGQWMDYHLDNCSISELVLGDDPHQLPELPRFNMTGHL